MDFRTPESLIFLELCNPFSSSLPASISDESWYYISELSQMHEVTPFFYYRVKTLGLSLPPQLMEQWRQIYLLQIVIEFEALRQIKEIKEILASEEIPMILLKGTSAMMRLYPEPGLRTFCDLDILIPDDKVSRFKQIMMMAGYKPFAPMYSPEYEDLQRFDNHLAPHVKKERIMIEPHVNILGGKGNYLIALREIWHEMEEGNFDGIRVSHLSKEQFIIHMLLHCAKDLTNIGFVQIKGLIDILYAVITWNVDWLELGDIARRWKIEGEILTFLSTINHYWKMDIPSTNEVVPLGLGTLLLGVEDQKKRDYARTPSRYIRRLLQARELPDSSSRIRYLFHLFFPTRESLRHCYNLHSKKVMAPYYLLHFVVMSKKYFMGLWHQYLCHLRNNLIT